MKNFKHQSDITFVPITGSIQGDIQTHSGRFTVGYGEATDQLVALEEIKERLEMPELIVPTQDKIDGLKRYQMLLEKEINLRGLNKTANIEF